MSEEDNVLKYTNQLEFSEYYEDQMEALENLYEISKNNVLIVGIYSLITIIKSIKKTNEHKIQSKIILKILKSYQKNEFVDIIIKDEECIIIFFEFKKHLTEVLFLVAKSKGNEIFDILQRKNSTHLLFVDFKMSITYAKYLITDLNKETFCHEGIFELILEILTENNHKTCIEIICMLLKDSLFNQNYFVELKWLEKFSIFKINEIIVQLLDKKNKNFEKNQKKFCNERFVDVKDYRLVECLIYNNPENFVVVESYGLDVYEVCNSCYERCNLNLIEEILKYKEIDFTKLVETSNYFYILSLIYMQQTNELYKKLNEKDMINEHLYVLFRLNELSVVEQISFVIYISLIGDEIVIPQNLLNIVKEFICDKRNSSVVQDFLFLMIYDKYKNIEIFEYTEEFYIARIKNLRYYLSKPDTFLTNKVKEYFFNKIDDKTLFFYHKDYHKDYNILIERFEKERIEQKSIKCDDDVDKSDKVKNDKFVHEKSETISKTSVKTATYKERLAGLINKMKYENNKKNIEDSDDNDLFEL